MLQMNNTSWLVGNFFRINRVNRAMAIGVVLMVTAVNSAHSELSIQEKEPQSSVVNQYNLLKNADESSNQLHQLISSLKQRVAANPEDSLAWELLAQIYYNNGYHAYAVYAASEAIEQGYTTTKLKKILLNSSAIVAESQLKAGYLSGDVDSEFLKEYQHALSKIYGEVYGFNYDESLPKPPAPVVRAKPAKVKSKARSKSSVISKKKAKAAVKKKPIVKKRPKAAPVKKPVKPAVRKSTPRSTDPFSILR